jgi:BirA family biotin operon repressor/biotin-[acetyl-CoA-carboxylase] ligase
MAPDLTPARLEKALGSWAPEYRYLDEVESTNLVAMEWAAEGAPDGCVVIADHQTEGRGRLGRSWFDRPGGSLLFSMILRPRLSMELVGLVNLVAGAAMASGLGDLGIEARVKWPNDVLVAGRKVCGMLAETKVSGRMLEVLVLGIGVNVTVAASELPEEVRDSATSLSEASGEPVERAAVLEVFLHHFGPRYLGIDGTRTGVLLDFYRKWCETLGTQVRVETPAGVVEGEASDVDGTGALVLESGETIRAGDVIHLR